MRVIDIKNGIMNTLASRLFTHIISKKLEKLEVDVITHEITVDCDDAEETIDIHMDCNFLVNKSQFYRFLKNYIY